MNETISYSIKMTGKEAADLILSGVYVRRVGVIPARSKFIPDRQTLIRP